MSETPILRRIEADAIQAPVADPPPPVVLDSARKLIAEVREGGPAALRACAERLDGLGPDQALVHDREDMERAREALPPDQRRLLQRSAERIATFARAQRQAVQDLTLDIPGGQAGHRVLPLQTAGCYAPAGRHPLPSSILMTAVTARVAGVETVVVATPRASQLMLAAAAVAGVDLMLGAGGAHAIAALAHGVVVPRADVIVGPGNAWVTAAKLLVGDQVRTDGAAGPSELVVVVDGASNPDLVAADLLAQAEHDPLARVAVIALDEAILPALDEQLRRRLATLPTAEVARQALEHGLAVVAADSREAVRLCNRLAPEHLQWTAGSGRPPQGLHRYGGLFEGTMAAEVLGDYAAGPNHVLPTGGQARSRGGLSVMDFLAVRTWLRLDDASAAAGLVDDAVALARLEGLEAHARAAAGRRDQPG